MTGRALAVLCTLAFAADAPQVSAQMDALVAAVRPALPFPAADANGELPAQGGAETKWFVVWPTESDGRLIQVKANPLHPDTQRASAAAMVRIQEVVEAAERKAQAAYDRALEEVKRSGKAPDLDGVTLEDEGIAGERIDAELALTIALDASPSFEIGSSVAPTTTPGSNGVTWTIATEANTYRVGSGGGMREHFRPAETRLIFGTTARPAVRRRGADHHFVVAVAPGARVFSVVLRGNEALLREVVTRANWGLLARTRPDLR